MADENALNAGSGSNAGTETLGGAVVDKSMQSAKPAAPAINLDTKVTVGGQELTLAQLAAEREAAAANARELEQLRQDQKVLFGRDDAPNDAARAATIRQYMAAGWSKDEAEAQAEKFYPSEKKPEGGVGESQTPREPSTAEQLTASMLRNHVKMTVTSALDSSEDVKAVLKVVADGGSPEEAAAFRANLDEELRRAAGVHLTNRITQERASGVTDVTWVEDAIKKAMPEVLKRIAPFVKMAKTVGRSTSPHDPLASYLAKTQPKAMPTVAEVMGMTASERDNAINTSLEDQLMRAASSALQSA